MTDFSDWIDLASERLGGSVLYATDDFFAEKENLLKATAPVWKEHEYTDRGKWMDGWESRRKRTPGHDYAIIRLGSPGSPRGVVVDTSYFRGNYPEGCSIDGCYAEGNVDTMTLRSDDRRWTEILPHTALKGDFQNLIPIDNRHAFTHLRFHIHPDGGVARLRVHGEVLPDWRRAGGLDHEIDLAAAENGARVLACSDAFFGPKHNLIMPGRPTNMSDGWETRRRRGAGNDWVIVHLALEGEIKRIEVDTTHFKGNFPDRCSIDGTRGELAEPDPAWSEVLPMTRLQADTRHFFLEEISGRGPWSRLRLNVFPDGGVARLRVWGISTETARRDAVVRRLDAIADPSTVEAQLLSCCGSSRWARMLTQSRPFTSWAQLTSRADEIWRALPPEEWLEAFRGHPRIGETHGSSWSKQEQRGARDATSEVLGELIRANREYEARFGHIFIVCATGKSAGEILSLLHERMANDPKWELQIAAEEQTKITQLRLRKLVSG